MLLLLTLDRNIVLYKNEKFTKTDNKLPIAPDPSVSLITLKRSNLQSAAVYMKRYSVLDYSLGIFLS